MKRFFSYLLTQKKKLIIVLSFAVLSTIASLLTPLIIAKAILHVEQSLDTRLSVTFDPKLLTIYIIVLIVAYLLSFLFKYIEQYVMAGVSETICLQMRNELASKLQKLPLNYYDKIEKGELLSRATNDIERINETLRQGLIQFVTAMLTIIGSIILMFFIEWRLLIIVIITIALVLFFTGLVSKKTYKYFNKYQTELGSVNGYIEEIFTGQMVLKAFNQEPNVINTFDKMNTDLFNISKKAETAIYLISPSVRIVNSISYIFIGFIGVLYFKLPLSTLQAFIQYTDRIADPTIESAYILNGIQQALSAASRVFEVLDQLDEVKDTPKYDEYQNFNGNVSLNNVSFGYYPNKTILNNISLNVSQGSKIAIVGPTGAGKTTLVNLLMRFYEISSGEILIDGINIQDISKAKLRSLFGMVLQDTWLFNGTISDNIGYSNENANRNEIITAANQAEASFIKNLPEQYDTKLNEDATNISQGQKQLLTIARVFLANPKIIILDEATSSVDTKTEKQIVKAMNKLMENRTSFIIAHRLSTIRDADTILVMDKGDIVEIGTHDELIAKKGFYYSLYNSQFEAI
ncbi:ABC-type multidrug/protein/lipid transport system ATPase component [Haploplasma axanthum]|uniref:ABC-type multidrug/protein/lipid transport system ATPase component n=2 Tax=Haploplasma axanthum TaxID=29552 RepID=A0A449BC45_HAPAX|nr:ABC-type multidrug/protein/lipid transport system ATPase component [Haploplasma axanthum]